MPILADCHLHSCFSGDSDAPMEAMIQRAISLGLSHMCFTEHMDLDFPQTPESPAGMFELRTDDYRAALMECRKRYEGQIQIGFGVELGMQPHINAENARYANACDFDFVIASTHLVDRMDPYESAYFAGRSQEEAYRRYFEAELESIASYTDYDVYGHIDYVIRYGRTRDKEYCYEKYADLFDRMIDLLLSAQKGIELNTGGLRKGLRQPHPCTPFLKRYRKMGGSVLTVGSDAHRAADVASHFGQAAEVLTDCGFTHYCTFRQRRPSFHRL